MCNFCKWPGFFASICCFSVILKLSAIRLQRGTSEFFLINATNADLIYSLTCNINSNNRSNAWRFSEVPRKILFLFWIFQCIIHKKRLSQWKDQDFMAFNPLHWFNERKKFSECLLRAKSVFNIARALWNGERYLFLAILESALWTNENFIHFFFFDFQLS